VRKIDDIQILRGVAILMVLTCHLSFSSQFLLALPFPVSNPFFAGVELFFVISGYVVTKSLMNGGFGPAPFLVRRIFRLYPPILVFLLLCLLINTFILIGPVPKFAFDLFGMKFPDFAGAAWAVLSGTLINYRGSSGYMNGAMWSLSVEFQFYAVTFGICLYAAVFQNSGRIASRLFLLLAAAVYLIGVHGRILRMTGSFPNFGAYIVNGRFDFMALGVLLAYCPDRFLTGLRRHGKPISIATVFAPIIVFALCRPVMSIPIGPDSLDGFGMLFAGLCYFLLVAVAAGERASIGLSPRERHVLLWIGERSYTIYLLHFPCMVLQWLAMYYFMPILLANAWLYAASQIAVVALFLIPLTELTYRHIELPAIALGSGLIRKWRSRHLLPASV
jgi:peptidoglycan/LPS O-acetylase OafA/YrhL